jgi:alkylation response protein AidB-like acyl-CoA dehydrogenase
MDTSLEDHQLALAKIADEFFASRSPISAVREWEASDIGYSPELWREMAGLDWLRLGHPEEDGGVGGGVLDLTVIYEAMGRTLAPSPHLDSAVISAGLLRQGTSQLTRDLLADVLAGDKIVVPAMAEEDAGYGPVAISLAGTSDGAGGLRLDGTKLLVAFANSASHFIVAARTSDTEDDGLTLAVVASDAPGVEISRLPNIGGQPLFAVTFSSVSVSADAVIGDHDAGWRVLVPVLDRAAVLRSAQIAGASDRLLEMSVEYAKQRSQFGHPIGSYQAVQYLCSDIAINGHLTLLYTRYAAAGVLDAGDPATRAVSEAKTKANHLARLAPERAHAVHAGIAFMLEFDVQLFTRRCRYWELDLGDDQYHRERVAAVLVA